MKFEGMKLRLKMGRRGSRRTRGVAGLAVRLLLVGSVILFIYVLFAESHAGDLPLDFYIVYGGSMSPGIDPGSLAVVTPVAPENLVVGDVITYRPTRGSQMPTTHRIISIDEEGEARYFTTRGDANPVADRGQVAPENIEGRLWFFIPYLGFLISGLRNPLNRMLFLAVPLVWMLMTEMKKFDEEKNTAGILRPHS